MVTVGLSASALAAIAVSTVHGSRRIRTFSANPDTAILEDLSGYVASGALRPVVSGVFPLFRALRNSSCLIAQLCAGAWWPLAGRLLY